MFSKSSALITRRPPLVATYRDDGPVYETWEADQGAQAIRKAVLGDGARALRIHNRQRAHGHFWRTLLVVAEREAQSRRDAHNLPDHALPKGD